MDPPSAPPFAALLRRYRLAAGLSQEVLAERARLSVEAIGALERGVRRAPYRDTVALIGDALALTSDERAALEDSVPRRRGRAGGAPAHPGPASSHLPAAATSFVGREQAQATVLRLLDASRLLTLTGSGGVGKTRLAMQVATGLAGVYPDGVRLVELAALTDPALVPSAAARALDVREQPGRSLTESLADALREKALLLIVDNCEHLREAAGALAVSLLRACPVLRIIATSREALGVLGETVWWVPSLALPEPAPAAEGPPRHTRESVIRGESAQLFCARAATAHPAFALSDANARAVAAICRRLDGIPLAIELAAARARVLTPEQIAVRLDERFRLLTGGSPEAPTRQQTLRAALDWSYDLLSEPERLLLQRLSVFAGGCEIEAVEAVCIDAAVPRDALFDLLTGLVEKSVLVVEYHGEAARYRLLETVRQYGAERLDAADGADAVRARLYGWALALAEMAAPRLTDDEQAAWLERLEAEHDNLRAVLRWTLEEGHAAVGLPLAGALWRFWQMRGHLTEGRSWLDQFFERGQTAPAAVRAAALLGAGSLAHDQGDFLRAAPQIEQALALAQEAGREATVADALMLLGALAWRQCDYDAAIAQCEESLAIARATDDRRLIARGLNLLGLIALDRGRYEMAHDRFDEALVAARGSGDLRTSAIQLSNLGLTAHRQEQFDRARSYLDEALAINRRLGNRTEIGRNLITLALVILGAGDSEGALERAREALAVAEEIGNRNGITEALNQLTLISRQRGDLVAAGEYSFRHLRSAREMQYPMQMLAAVWQAAANARAGDRATPAVRLIAASEAYREAAGIAQSSVMQATMEEHVASLRDLIGEPAFAAAWAAGAAMSQEEAVAYALSDAAG